MRNVYEKNFLFRIYLNKEYYFEMIDSIDGVDSIPDIITEDLSMFLEDNNWNCNTTIINKWCKNFNNETFLK